MAGQLEPKKRGKEMDGEGKRRGEDPPTLRDGGQVERRGSGKGKGDKNE